MEKKDIIALISQTIKTEGYTISKNVKTGNWKADIVVSLQNYKIAFTIGKRFTDIESTYKAMKSERVCGVWMCLDRAPITYNLRDMFPSFCLSEKDNDIIVKVDDYFSLPICKFISLMINGKIRKSNNLRLKSVNVYIYPIECWKCGHIHHVYFIKSLTGSDNRKYSGHGISCFDSTIIQLVKQHIVQHPELQIEIGEIKSRYSKTMNESYPSFGCPKCDAIVGQFYLREDFMDLYYDESGSNIHKINVEDSNITFPLEHWEIDS